MKKFSKSGPPARDARSGPAARKPFTRDRDREAPSRSRPDRDAPSRARPARTDAGAQGFRPRSAEGGAPRGTFRRGGEGAAPARSAYGNPYEPARRPYRSEPAEGVRAGPARSFTVNLDPDVARVFRGDASVNKALRLVLQMMQVVEGPPRGDRPAPRPRGYQGSDEARGFTRKPRFAESEEGEDVE